MCIEFKVIFKGGTKELLTLTEELAAKGVNLATIAMEKAAGVISLRFYPSNIERARKSLKEAEVKFTEKEVLLIEVEDRLGQYATIARKLHGAGVEIVASHVMTTKGDKMWLVFEVDNIDAGKRVLSDQLVEVE